MLPARLVLDQKHKQSDEAGSRASWNTPRSDSRTVMSYGMRMALSFAARARGETLAGIISRTTARVLRLEAAA